MSRPSNSPATKVLAFGTGNLPVADAPLLSMVVPAHREPGNLERLCTEILACLDSLGGSWELAIVDDGSPDDACAVIRAVHERDPRVGGVRLSRNFGHQYLASVRSACFVVTPR
jgi:Glycosyl transferase family 2